MGKIKLLGVCTKNIPNDVDSSFMKSLSDMLPNDTRLFLGFSCATWSLLNFSCWLEQVMVADLEIE